jgi:cytidylate kinase
VIIAIDGPGAAGKGTLARRLAAHFGLAYLDSGRLYRAVALRLLRDGRDPEKEGDAIAAAQALQPGDLDDPALKGDEIAQMAAKAAIHPGVRDVLTEFQRRFAAAPPGGAVGAVIDGRDIGTVVCPDAPIKLFVTAEPEIRAERRALELRQRGQNAIYARVLEELKARDARDRGRAVAPLVIAKDAYVLDTTVLDPDAVFTAALAFITARTSQQAR